MLAWLAGTAAVVAVLGLFGVDVVGWFESLWDALTGIGLGYLAAGWSLQTLQTMLTALGWYFILRAGYPAAAAPYRQVLAAYATGVALNGFLPANIGTFVMLLMFIAIIPGANLPGVLGGMLVQKIFFTFAGAFVYVYLFASVPGTLDRQFELPHDHPGLSLVIGAGAVLLIAALVRIFRRKLPGLIERAKQGGAILARPREYLVRVVLPSFGAWLAKLGVIAVFLAGYGITVSFHTIMSVMGGNSIANVVSVTPGGVGVNQATNVAALGGVTDAATATAYSLGQQLAVTAWNIAFAVALVVWAFGWAGGQGARRDVLRRREGQGCRPEGATSRGAGGKARHPRRVSFPLAAAAAVGRATPFAGRAFPTRRPYSRAANTDAEGGRLKWQTTLHSVLAGSRSPG